MKEKKTNSRLDITTEIILEKGAKLEYGEVEAIVSNSGVDRHGEQIMLEGIDLKSVQKNAPVLWGHEYSSLPIGKITKIWKSAGQLMARFKLATEIYDFANIVYKLILGEFIKAVSIGGIVREWDTSFTKVLNLEMLELSVVPIGAHPDALIVSKTLGLKPQQVTDSYEYFLKTELNKKLKNLTNPSNTIVVLENLVEALKGVNEKEKSLKKEKIIIKYLK